MTEDIGISNNMIEDLQGLEIETFKIEQLDELDIDAAVVSLCSSTTSSSCCG